VQPKLSEEDRVTLARSADLGVRFVHSQWEHIRENRRAPSHDGDVLGWMQTDDYLKLAAHSLQTKVIDPLRARGIPVTDRLAP